MRASAWQARMCLPDVAHAVQARGIIMLSDFKAFIAKGNVMQLAVAVIIGGAFGTIVTSLTDDVIMPLVGAIFGGSDFSAYFILLSVPEGYTGDPADYAALKEAGAAMIGYGAFLTAIINFLILAFIIFLLVRYTNRTLEQLEQRDEVTPPEEAAGPTEIGLLTEIRDALTKRD
jgi:large conductance mechanosensitive channel